MTDRLGNKLSDLQLHHDLVSILREEIGLVEIFAEQFAAAIAAGLKRRLGGQEIYIPAEDKRSRDEHIRAEFCGTNRESVMSKYGISKTRLYEIVGNK